MQMCVARACQDRTWDPPSNLVLCCLMPSCPLSTLLLQLLPSGQTSSELSAAVTFSQGSVFLTGCVCVCVASAHTSSSELVSRCLVKWLLNSGRRRLILWGLLSQKRV